MRQYGTMYSVALVLIAVFILVRYWDPPPVEVARLKSFDFYQQAHPRQLPPGPIPVKIIDIDEESLAELGQWPWPRTLLAKLVTKLTEARVAAIGFDVVFAEPDRSSPDSLIETVEGIDESTRELIAGLPRNDMVFAEAVKRSPTVLGQSTTTRVSPIQRETKAVKTAVAEIGGDPRPKLFDFLGITRNIAELEAVAKGLGMFTLKPEIDGVVRRVPMFVKVEDKLYPSLTLEMLRVATGKNAVAIKSNAAGIDSVVAKPFVIPTDSYGRTWVHYAPHSRDRYISAKDILDGSFDAARLRGHFILVGTSAVGLLDIKATPVDDAMPGVEVHAQLLETVFTQSHLDRPNIALTLELALIIGMSVLLVILVPLVGAIWSLLVGFGVTVVLLGGSWYLYTEENIMLDAIFPAAAGFVLYSVLTYMNYVREEAQRRQVRTAFAHYMSPALVEELARDPDRLTLGGEMRDMTMLFCDIRGFTAISEQYKSDPEGLTTLINLGRVKTLEQRRF